MSYDWLGHVAAAFAASLKEDNRLGRLIGDGLGELLKGRSIDDASSGTLEFATNLHALLTSPTARGCSEASDLISSGVRNDCQRKVLGQTINAALRDERLSARYSTLTISLALELAKVLSRPTVALTTADAARSSRTPVSTAKGPERRQSIFLGNGRQLGRREGR